MPAVKPQRALDSIKPYVPGRGIEEVQRAYGVTDVVKLASNENQLEPSPRLLQALCAALPSINLYPDPQAHDLRIALARHFQVPPDWVFVGNGEDGVIRNLCVTYLDEGDEVVVSRSSFPVYDISTQVMRAKIVKAPLAPDLRCDLAGMARAITERTKIVFVCNPNNPTGTISHAAELAALMAAVPERVLVVIDEAYFEFVDDPDFPDSLRYVREGRPNVIVLRSFSKTYGMAGLRLGYGIAQPELLTPLYSTAESFPVNRLALIAGLAALEDPDYVRQTVDTVRTGLAYLYPEFDRLGLRYVRSQANFVLVEIGTAAREVIELLLRQGVIVRPCSGYDLPEFARITVGTPAQNRRLVESLARALEQVRVPA